MYPELPSLPQPGSHQALIRPCCLSVCKSSSVTYVDIEIKLPHPPSF